MYEAMKMLFNFSNKSFNLPVITGAPPVQTERQFFQGNPFCSKVLHMESYTSALVDVIDKSGHANIFQ